MVFANIEALTKCMRSHEIVHFNFHFRNMLTDGKQVYLTDFGLPSTSSLSIQMLSEHSLNCIIKPVKPTVEIFEKIE